MEKRRQVSALQSVLAAFLCAVLLLPLTASALILTGRGNDPVHDPGWPLGALEVANLKSRVGWWEGPPFGGGYWNFSYRGNTEAFIQALTNFAAIRAPALDLVIHDGPQEGAFLKDSKDTNTNAHVDWTFAVWIPENWHRLYNNPRSVFGADQPQFRQLVDPPRLDVYVGGSGGVDWAKVKVPAKVRVRDERASAAGVEPVGGALIRVEAYDMKTGKPVPSTRVVVAKLSEAQAGTRQRYEPVAEAAGGDSGEVEVSKIPAGTYRVSLEAAGYAPRVLGYDRYGERSFKKFTTDLAKLASVSGIVTDGAGQPVSNVTVRASTAMGMDGRGYRQPEDAEVTTDTNGRFELTRLPAGFVQLSANAPGYHFTDHAAINDSPSADISLRVYRAGGIRGVVTDKAGQPISRLEGNPLLVNVEDSRKGLQKGTWGGGGKVKEDGTFEFNNVPPGEYRLTSRPNPGSVDRQYAKEQVVNVTAGPPVEVKVVYE